MQVRVKLPKGEAVANFPPQFNQRGKKKSTEAFLNSVVSGVLNVVASLKPGFADLMLGTDLKLGTEFRDIIFREIEWMKLGTDLKLGTDFRDIKFREIEFREIEDLKLNAELDFNRNPRRRRRR